MSQSSPALHDFTKSEISEAKELLRKEIVKVFGEVWRVKSDGAYKTYQMKLPSPLLVPQGVWLLVQKAKHTGAARVAGYVDTENSGSTIVLNLIYARDFRI